MGQGRGRGLGRFKTPYAVVWRGFPKLTGSARREGGGGEDERKGMKRNVTVEEGHPGNPLDTALAARSRDHTVAPHSVDVVAQIPRRLFRKNGQFYLSFFFYWLCC